MHLLFAKNKSELQYSSERDSALIMSLDLRAEA